MADHAEDGGDDNDDVMFVYMGGVIPLHLRYTVTHIRIHKSVKIISESAFRYCRRLISIEMHDGVEIIERDAFYECAYLKRIKLSSVRVIGNFAFFDCFALEDVVFGCKLETVAVRAFDGCISLRNIKIPNVKLIMSAFSECYQLTEVELSKALETIQDKAFWKCPHLRRIALPLKANLLGNQVFLDCNDLSQVDLVGGIHKTVSSLLLESWRNEMKNEIDRINQVLPNTHHDEKTVVIQQWMEAVIHRIEHYKAEHHKLLKEFTTLLELALWKANLDGNVGDEEGGRVTRGQRKRLRKDRCITSGASIVIKNVLPFLKLE